MERGIFETNNLHTAVTRPDRNKVLLSFEYKNVWVSERGPFIVNGGDDGLRILGGYGRGTAATESHQEHS